MRWETLKKTLAVAAMIAVSGGVIAAATPLKASARSLDCMIVVPNQDACTTYCNDFHPGWVEAYWNPVDGCCTCFF
jgi:hypothetical protein